MTPVVGQLGCFLSWRPHSCRTRLAEFSGSSDCVDSKASRFPSQYPLSTPTVPKVLRKQPS